MLKTEMSLEQFHKEVLKILHCVDEGRYRILCDYTTIILYDSVVKREIIYSTMSRRQYYTFFNLCNQLANDLCSCSFMAYFRKNDKKRSWAAKRALKYYSVDELDDLFKNFKTTYYAQIEE